MADLNAEVKKVSIIDTKGVEHLLTGKNPEAQINSIKITESIDLYTLTAEIEIFDTAINLIASAPIVGTEIIKMELISPNISNEVYEYEFVVYGIRNRIVSTNKQLYTLDCFSKEALRNETIRVGSTITGTADNVVDTVIKNYLQSDKDITSEKCLYEIKQIPSLKRPFDIVNSLLPECVSEVINQSSQSAKSSVSNSTSNGVEGGVTQAVTKNNADAVISGSAGYMFFETYNGYIFKSIDKLITEEQTKHPTYEYGYAQEEGSNEKTNSYLILNYSFGKQENILEKMRYGVYSSMIAFFNPSTLEYEEYFFDLSKEYSSMHHLGTDEKIPDTIKKLSDYPTRVMFQVFDHETYYNSTGVADPSAGGGTQYPDFKKQWMAQSISRMTILNNQILNITIPINLKLRAGDKLNVKLPNQSVSSQREKEKYDKVNSGLYLIKTISYNIIRDNNKGLIAVCNAILIRDNLGS
jgi:hypothetical protein